MCRGIFKDEYNEKKMGGVHFFVIKQLSLINKNTPLINNETIIYVPLLLNNIVKSKYSDIEKLMG